MNYPHTCCLEEPGWARHPRAKCAGKKWHSPVGGECHTGGRATQKLLSSHTGSHSSPVHAQVPADQRPSGGFHAPLDLSLHGKALKWTWNLRLGQPEKPRGPFHGGPKRAKQTPGHPGVSTGAQSDSRLLAPALQGDTLPHPWAGEHVPPPQRCSCRWRIQPPVGQPALLSCKGLWGPHSSSPSPQPLPRPLGPPNTGRPSSA